MSVSLPSPKISLVDVPEVKDFRAQFVYNFFTPDESHNVLSNIPNSIRKVPAESFDAERIEKIRKIVPRFVRFDFSPIVLPQGIFSGNEFTQNAFQRQKLTIAKNISQIQSEEQFAGKLHTGFEFQDNNLDLKLFTLVSGSIAKRVSSKNRNIQAKLDENRQTVIDNLNSEHSLLDASKALAEDTSDTVSNNVIVNALNQIDALKLSFIDEKTQKITTDETFDRVKNVAVKCQISNKLIGRIVKNIVNDPMSQFADEFSTLQFAAHARQKETIASLNPAVFSLSEFVPKFRALEVRAADSLDSPAAVKLKGYIIEKSEITSDGKILKHPPIVIENPSTTSAVDLAVVYGRTYVYTIRTVVQLKVHASADDVVIATGLMMSRRSARIFVNCIESVPPPCVADFNISWNFTVGSPMLTWSFPTNPQRDIKRFQIFRRKSITEPFQLIKEFDFDDSHLRINNGETPDPNLVEKLQSPVTSFIDREFTKESSYIYSICCIDAHGFSSNYSMQLQISFDGFKNKLRKKLISCSGAPKSYPNMNLLHDTFSDTMKVSEHTKCTVIFDPEFLEVFDSENNDLKLLATDRVSRDAKYRLQFINTDVQKQEIVDIRIQDRRTKT